ncbi:hypothetical protein HGO38_16295 [Rhizobium sp. CG5]|uniref:hypothetical protein n=1 Tax=Rhizobium sp. CG5 TaxID=2726076 RepID=UPI00203362F9|nr:hypothetical protein [Rhizobium sp. CG5]MCM2475041.1 hypothetical protein [Rhizobium sp. CG5]
MPAKFDTTKAELYENCTVEDAEPIFDWLRKTAAGVLDVAHVTHLHTAVLQTIMATGNTVGGLPADHFVAECIRQAKLSQI